MPAIGCAAVARRSRRCFFRTLVSIRHKRTKTLTLLTLYQQNEPAFCHQLLATSAATAEYSDSARRQNGRVLFRFLWDPYRGRSDNSRAGNDLRANSDTRARQNSRFPCPRSLNPTRNLASSVETWRLRQNPEDFTKTPIPPLSPSAFIDHHSKFNNRYNPGPHRDAK
jgi:hypothetical protein